MDKQYPDRNKTLSSGFEITLSQSETVGGYDVDCWKPETKESHWHKFFLAYEDAKREYDRWKD